MAEHFPKLILASRSPRRRELLAAAGYAFEVWPPAEDAEGGTCSGETPEQLVARLAYQKAADVVRRIEADIRKGCWAGSATATPTTGRQECLPHCETCCLVLGCDTVVECRGQILGKPDNEEHAREILQILSGQVHRVLSGLCLWCVDAKGGGSATATPTNFATATPTNLDVRVAVSVLRMDELSPRQIDEYLAGGQWEGKAGAFGYQDGLDWVHLIEGSASNVVGLPMELFEEMAKEHFKK